MAGSARWCMLRAELPAAPGEAAAVCRGGSSGARSCSCQGCRIHQSELPCQQARHQTFLSGMQHQAASRTLECFVAEAVHFRLCIRYQSPRTCADLSLHLRCMLTPDCHSTCSTPAPASPASEHHHHETFCMLLCTMPALCSCPLRQSGPAEAIPSYSQCVLALSR